MKILGRIFVIALSVATPALAEQQSIPVCDVIVEAYQELLRVHRQCQDDVSQCARNYCQAERDTLRECETQRNAGDPNFRNCSRQHKALSKCIKAHLEKCMNRVPPHTIWFSYYECEKYTQNAMDIIKLMHPECFPGEAGYVGQ
jgi:hypothetical protein